MATLNFKQVVDFFKNEIRNAVLHKVSGAPSSPVEGQIWYDTAGKKFVFQNDVGAIDPTARANHTGTQVASTISDFNTAVRTNTLNQMAAPTVDLAIGTHKITGLQAGTGSGHAVEYDQMNTAVASAVAGTSWKVPARLATVTNDTLTGLAAREGVTPVDGDRVLVKNQTTAADNGIYNAHSGAWTRATDADSAAELQGGVLIAVDEGTTQADTAWMLTADVVTLGTTAQSWIPFGVGSSYVAGAGLVLSASTFNVGAGTGIVVNADDVALAPSVVRKSAVGYVGTSGVDVTINHGFALAVKEDLMVNVWEVGVGLVQCGVVPTDLNNVVLSFAVTPTTNQYRYSMIGLS